MKVFYDPMRPRKSQRYALTREQLRELARKNGVRRGRNTADTVANLKKARLVRRFRWNITNERTGETCTYNAAHGIPVTEDHVRMSPKVREWANGDSIRISPPNDQDISTRR